MLRSRVAPSLAPLATLLVWLAVGAVSGEARAAAAPALPPAPPELLLTFDDGPHLERTPRVLDVLDQYGVKAIFFVNGMRFVGDSPQAEKGRALLREIIARGHYVGNHTVHHYFLCGTRGPKVAEAEIEDNARLIEKAIGFRPELFRTPYGSHCKSLSKTLDRLKLRHVGWDIDPQDWKVLNTKKVREYVIAHLSHLSGRNILLMHDIHECTVEALPQILEWLRRENAARIERKETPVRIVDYGYLLPPRSPIPAILDGIGRVLIHHWWSPARRRAVLRLAGLPRTS